MIKDLLVPASAAQFLAVSSEHTVVEVFTNVRLT